MQVFEPLYGTCVLPLITDVLLPHFGITRKQGAV